MMENHSSVETIGTLSGDVEKTLRSTLPFKIKYCIVLRTEEQSSLERAQRPMVQGYSRSLTHKETRRL